MGRARDGTGVRDKSTPDLDPDARHPRRVWPPLTKPALCSSASDEVAYGRVAEALAWHEPPKLLGPRHREVVAVSIGPVEYIILSFPGNRFQGEIVPALAKLIDSETVRIIDLVFILKDADGNVTTFEFDQLEELAPYATLQGEVGGLVNQEDIEYAAHALEPNNSAALLVWEDTWATEFAEAVRGAGGVVLEGARIPPDLVDAALAELSTSD